MLVDHSFFFRTLKSLKLGYTFNDEQHIVREVRKMKVVSKRIEMIAYFKKDGKINPIRFRLEEENKCQVIKIGKIISTDVELCGNKMWVFTCSAVIGDVEKIFELKYDVDKIVVGHYIKFNKQKAYFILTKQAFFTVSM